MTSGSWNPFSLQPKEWRTILWTVSGMLVVGSVLDWILQSAIHGIQTEETLAAVLLGYWPAAI